MKEKKVEFELNGKREYVVLRELTFGEWLEVVEKSVEMEDIGSGVLKRKIKPAVFMKTLLLKSIKEASFTVTADFIEKLPVDIGTKLFEEASNLNPFR